MDEFEEERFGLSKLSIIAIVAIVLIISGINLLAFGTNAYGFGTITGTLGFVIVVPLVIALLVFRSTGKKSTANLAFLLLLLMFSSTTLKKTFERLQKRSEFMEYARETDFDTVTNPNAMMDEMMTQMDNAVEGASPDEKAVFRIMQDFLAEVQVVGNDWSESFDSVQSPTILDLSLLHNVEECQRQKQVVQTFIKHSKSFQKFNKESEDILTKRFAVLGPNNKMAQSALKGFRESRGKKWVGMNNALEYNVDYGEKMIAVIAFLEEKTAKWRYDSSVIHFDVAEEEEQYSQLMESFSTVEEQMFAALSALYQ